MLNSSKQSGSGSIFHISPRNSDFNQAYRNNMDNNSYVGTKNVIKGALSHPDTAFFETVDTIDYSKEYQNCQVFIYYILRYS